MTREELKAHCERQIKECEMWAKRSGKEPGGKIYEEHKLILELLHTEPCEDCVSRQVAINIIPEVIGGQNDFADCIRDGVEAVINACPSVQPVKTGWVPVRRLPETVDFYLTSIAHSDGTKKAIISWFDGCSFKAEVKAWMPLPEPYKESEDKG